jgi:hypothetical protein
MPLQLKKALALDRLPQSPQLAISRLAAAAQYPGVKYCNLSPFRKGRCRRFAHRLGPNTKRGGRPAVAVITSRCCCALFFMRPLFIRKVPVPTIHNPTVYILTASMPTASMPTASISHVSVLAIVTPAVEKPAQKSLKARPIPSLTTM